MNAQNRKQKISSKLPVIFLLLVSLCILAGTPLTASNLAASETQKDFDELIGRWIRSDAGYIIEIKNIDTDGKMEAGYYNPRPINVSEAKAAREKIGIKIFIELRDVGYPGSTYTLLYIPQKKILAGFYYQAKLGQNFEVLFAKMK